VLLSPIKPTSVISEFLEPLVSVTHISLLSNTAGFPGQFGLKNGVSGVNE
jgi:hypothetical protein